MRKTFLHYHLSSYLILIALLLLFLLPGCISKRAPVQAVAINSYASPDSLVLTAIALGAGQVVQLCLAPGEDNQYPIQLRLIQNTQLIASENLAWSAASRQLGKDIWYGPWHNISSEPLPAYTLGTEYQQVTSSIELVQISSEKKAILVRQLIGFEHLKKRYDLFIIENKKFIRIWSDIEGEGPISSDAALIDKGNIHEILYINGLAPSYLDKIDEYYYPEVKRLYWSDKNNSLMQETATELSAILLEKKFVSIDDARRFLVQLPQCLEYYWVMESDIITGLSKNGPVIATIAVDKTHAEQEISRLNTCNPDLKVRLITINSLEIK